MCGCATRICIVYDALVTLVVRDNTHHVTMWLYATDKCFILMMMWGFHYHFEPYSAKITALPVVWGVKEIVLYQHEYFQTHFAYFDVLLLSYVACVSFLIIHLMKTHNKLMGSILLMMCMIEYGMEIHGLMHIMLAPGFWLCYEEFQVQQLTTQEKEEEEEEEEKKNLSLPQIKKE